MAQGQQFPIFITARSDPDQRAFDDFVTKASDAGKRASSAINQSMAGVKDTIAQALSIPRNAGGSLDLQISQLRQMEAEMEAVARVTLQYANASKSAAITSGETSRARNNEIRAAFELARVESENLTQLRAKIAILDQVQTELNQTAAATDKVIASTNRGTDAYGIHNASLRGSRVAMIQAGQQLQDMAIQFQMGTRASTVFSQQIPQLMFALTSLEGSANGTANKIGKFATLMSGPLSLAVVAGSALLGGLIDHFLGTGDAADKGGSAIDTLANKLDLSKNSYESLIAVVDEYNKTQSDSIARTYEEILVAEKAAEANLKLAEAKLALAKASASANAGQGTAGAAGAYTGLNVSLIENEVAKLKSQLGESRIARAGEEAKRATDERYKIETGYRAERAQMYAESEDLAKKGLFTDQKRAEYEKRRIDSINAETVALKAYDDAHRKTRGSSGSEAADASVGSMTALLKQLFGPGTYIGNNSKHSKYTSSGTISDHYGKNARALDFVPEGGLGKYSYEQVQQILEDAGVKIRYGRSGTKQFFGPGHGAKTANDHNSHFHIAWEGNIDPGKVAEAMEKASKRNSEAIDRLADSSSERVSRINEAFDEQPKLIDRANQATRELDRTMADLEEKLVNDASLTDQQRENMAKTYAEAVKAKATIQDALVRPFRELREESQRRLQVETLLTQGREDEARALQEIWRLESTLGPLTEQRKAEILGIVRNEREVTEELRRRQEIIGQYLDATRSVKQELVSIFSGEGSFSNFGKIFKQLNSQILVEKLFGGALRDFDKWIKGQSGLGDSVDYLASETDRGAGAVKTFADAVLEQARRISNPGSAGGSLQSEFDATLSGGGFISAGGGAITSWLKAVNDNTTELTVVGRSNRGVAKSIETNLSPDQWARKLSGVLAGETLASFGIKSKTLQGVLGGAFYGNMTGGPVGAVLGGLQGIPGLPSGLSSALGSGLKGAQNAQLIQSLASRFGIHLSNTGSSIGGAAGGAIGGIWGPAGEQAGSAIGSVLGGIIGKLFGKRPRGAAEVSNSSVFAHTNDNALTSSTNDWGSNVQSAVQRVADALGVNVGNYSIGLGRYRDYYQVSTQSGDPRLGNSYFGRDSRNSVYDGTDAEAATRAAVIAAIQNGAIAGISQASLNILKAGKDLDAALKKAVLIESIPKRLKQLTDPVGAAIDELNKQFEEMIAALKEGGATAEQFAQAQKLYDLQRAQAVKQAVDQVTGSLKSLLDSLTVGNDALSLRDRKAAALANYTPLAARVAAGDTSAYGDFADAARALLDIERQISGSQSGYFELLNQVTDLTRTQLQSQQSLIDAANSGSNPFTSTSPGTTPANDNSSVVGAIGDSNALLTNINDNLIAVGQQIAAVLSGVSTGGGGGQYGMNSNVANF